MTRIFAARAKALEITNTLSGAWQSGAHWYSDQSGALGQWDSTKYDILGGMFYHEGQAILSGQLQVQQALASGQWDLTTAFTPKLNTGFEFEVPLRGSFVRVHLRHAAATSNQNVSGPSVLRLGTWGKVADSVVDAKQKVWHGISGDWIPQAANESGQIEVFADRPNAVKAASTLQLNNASGGVILTSAAVQAVVVKSVLRNSGDIYLGNATGSDRPYSNFGFLLSVGESVSLEIDQIGRLAAFAQVSGDRLTFMGVDRT